MTDSEMIDAESYGSANHWDISAHQLAMMAKRARNCGYPTIAHHLEKVATSHVANANCMRSDVSRRTEARQSRIRSFL